jgi:competence protein ComEC
VRVRVTLGPWHERRNPGSRSRQRQLERAGVGAVARLVHPSLHVRLPDHEGVRMLAPAHAARARIGDRLESAGTGGPLLRALALGDRGALPTASREAFAALGLSHLLAVSGLHLTLVAGWAFALARGGFSRSARVAARWDARHLALGVAWVAAALYAVAAGWGVPVRRALVLFTGLALAVVRGRAGGRAEPLAAAAMLVLAADPGALFDPGAQLSFAASAALSGTIDEGSQATGSRIAGALRQAIRASATALAVTSPIAAYHFAQVAPGALLANAIAVPWTALVLLPAALLATATTLVPGSGFVLIAAERIAAFTLAAVEGAAAWLPGSAAVAPPALSTLVVAAALGGAALRSRRTRWRAAWAFAAGLVLAAAPPPGQRPAPPRLVALDVGQGDAFLVQGRRASVLVDAGTALEGYDVGRRVVLPALAALGVNELDLVIATHGDLDHRGGLPSVLRALPVGAVWIPRGARSDPSFADLLAAARAREVPIYERGAGSTGEEFGDLRVTPLWPPRAGSRSSRNDRSLVVRIDVGARRLLLAGDVEAAAERALVESGAELRADVIVLPHHGSRTSSSRDWIRAVQAEVAVASAPCRGRFGMPHPEVLGRARDADLPVWWTGRDGAVMVGLAEPLVVWGYGDAPSHCRDR